jgi:hypothetical protein
MLAGSLLDLKLKQPRFYSNFEGNYRVSVIDWFVRKVCYQPNDLVSPAADGVQGHKLKEDEHTSAGYYHTRPITEGCFEEVEVMLYSFESEKDRHPLLHQEHG